jgi:hypothetical protein
LWPSWKLRENFAVWHSAQTTPTCSNERTVWARTNYKRGQKLDMDNPKDRAMAKVWLSILAELQQEEAVIEEVLSALREQSRTLAQRAETNIVGVAVSATGSQWFTPAFQALAEAEAWLARVSADPTSFLYAAYFDKTGPMWPFPTGEAVGQLSTSAPVA